MRAARTRAPRPRAGERLPSQTSLSRGWQLAILAGGFAAGTALAGALGAISLGVAFGVGQIGFAIALVWVLLRC
jgi:hypothetical protein